MDNERNRQTYAEHQDSSAAQGCAPFESDRRRVCQTQDDKIHQEPSEYAVQQTADDFLPTQKRQMRKDPKVAEGKSKSDEEMKEQSAQSHA